MKSNPMHPKQDAKCRKLMEVLAQYYSDGRYFHSGELALLTKEATATTVLTILRIIKSGKAYEGWKLYRVESERRSPKWRYYIKKEEEAREEEDEYLNNPPPGYGRVVVEKKGPSLPSFVDPQHLALHDPWHGAPVAPREEPRLVDGKGID